MTWHRYTRLLSGSVLIDEFEGPVTLWGTCVSPVRFFQFKTPEELRAEAREAAAAEVLAVFRELKVDPLRLASNGCYFPGATADG